MYDSYSGRMVSTLLRDDMICPYHGMVYASAPDIIRKDLIAHFGQCACIRVSVFPAEKPSLWRRCIRALGFDY